MKIADRDTIKHVLIVAEIGNNHEGNFDIAKELVQKAAECGVDAVKFQTFRTEHYVSAADSARFNRLKSFELSYPQFAELAQLAHTLGLLFLSTPFDLGSADFLAQIVDAYKIASGDNNFYPLIGRAARTAKPLIISSGSSDLVQLERTVAWVQEQWATNQIADGQLAILHCVSAYPVAPDQANLQSILTLAERFSCTVGYSDHTIGIEAAMLAVALGARIIEKHFTLDKHYSDFRDHQLSADPTEMRELVHKVRLASSLLGTREKTIQACEASARQAIRRSIVAGRDLPTGHCLTFSDLTWIRPAGGLAPGEEHVLIGKRLNRNVQFGEVLTAADVEGA